MKRISELLGIVAVCALCGSVLAEGDFYDDPHNFLSPEEKPTIPFYDKSISDVEALDIAEATFRYQFQQYQIIVKKEGAKYKIGAYFLSLFLNDPTSDFLKRFKGYETPVKKGTEFSRGMFKLYEKKLPQAGDKFLFKTKVGIWFRIGNIKRISQEVVEVTGGQMDGPGSMSGYTYTLALKGNKWIVTSAAMGWIS